MKTANIFSPFPWSKPFQTGQFFWLAAIALLSFGIFRGSLGFFFSQDDFFFLYRVARISSFQDFLEAFLSQDRFFYRPWSRVVLFFIPWKIFGWDAASFHWLNIAWQAFNGCLVFLLLNRIFNRPLLAGLSAVLFVSHPVSFLAVYWISGIQELSMTAFSLLSLWLYLKSKESASGRKVWLGGLSVLAFALALLSKELALVTVILLPLVDWTQARQRNSSVPWRPPVAQLVPHLGVLLLYLLINRKTLLAVLTSSGPYGTGVSLKMIVIHFSAYLGEIFYLKHATGIPALGVTLTGYLLLTALLVYALRTKPDRPAGVFGIGWFLIALSPVLLVAQRTYSYYAYLSLAGMVILLAFPISAGLEFLDHHYRTRKGTRLGWLAEGLGLALLLFLWWGLSLNQVRAKEIEDPAGILSKGLLAQTALREIKARYPEIPPGSELYLTGAGERERWAVGQGDLFRLIYPGIRVSFVDPPGRTALNGTDANLYWFQIPRLQ